MIDIEDVKTLTVGPNQMLVIQVNGILSTEIENRIKDAINNKAPLLKGRVMIIGNDVSLSVIDVVKTHPVVKC